MTVPSTGIMSSLGIPITSFLLNFGATRSAPRGERRSGHGEQTRARHERRSMLLFAVTYPIAQFCAHGFEKLGHLVLHSSVLLAKVENDFDPGKIHAHVTRKRQDHLQPLAIAVVIVPRIPNGAKRFHKPFALVHPECLRMYAVALGDCADRVPFDLPSWTTLLFRHDPSLSVGIASIVSPRDKIISEYNCVNSIRLTVSILLKNQESTRPYIAEKSLVDSVALKFYSFIVMNRKQGYKGMSTESGEPVEVTANDQGREAQAEYKDLYLRTLADFDNYRKRVERERDDIGAAGKRDLLLGIVDVIDNFERALDSAADIDGECGGIAAGVTAIYRQMRRLLESNGVEPFESVGEPFDPERHEAVGVTPSDSVPEDYVVSEIRSGYTWNGRLLRPAKVFVSSGSQTV